MGANKAHRCTPLIHFYCSGCADFHTSAKSLIHNGKSWNFQHECMAYPTGKQLIVNGGTNMGGTHKPTGFSFTQIGREHKNDELCNDCYRCRNPRLPFNPSASAPAAQ